MFCVRQLICITEQILNDSVLRLALDFCRNDMLVNNIKLYISKKVLLQYHYLWIVKVKVWVKGMLSESKTYMFRTSCIGTV